MALPAIAGLAVGLPGDDSALMAHFLGQGDGIVLHIARRYDRHSR